MNRYLTRLAVLLASLGCQAFLSGCIPQTISPRVEGAGVKDYDRPDWADWALVLNRCVVEDQFNYRKLVANPRALERTMAMLAATGPESTPQHFPRHEDRLAYYINAYNASIVRAVMALERDGVIPRTAPWGWEQRFRLKIDGRLRTPRDLRQLALKCAGDDFRARMAMCDGRRAGPPLHPRPLLGDMLDGQLNFVTRMALYSPNMVRTEIGGERRLLLWSGLYDARLDMIADYERRMGTTHATILNVLGEWSNRKRREILNSAVGYIVARMPDDDLINQVDPPPAESGLFSLF